MRRRHFLITSSILAATGLPLPGIARPQETHMRKVMVFNSISLDGYFTDNTNDMAWAHKRDPEWQAFTAENAGGDAELLFGRKTYEMMAGFWPTPPALQAMPKVAESMNRMRKTVFSRTLSRADWQNTRVVKGDIADEVRRMKHESGPDVLIMGSGEIIAQLTQARLIDNYQVVLTPIVLGRGRSMFEGVTGRPALQLTKTRSFGNGNVVMWYELAA
jgi:dihydrofolate reductase